MKKIIFLLMIFVLGAMIFFSNACRKITPPVLMPTHTYTNTQVYYTPTFTPTATVTPTAFGLSWTQSTAAAGFEPRTQSAGLVYNGKMWVITGADLTNRFKDAWSSTDGISWIAATRNAAFTGRYGHTVAVYTNASGPAAGTEKMWIMGGYNSGYFSDVWYTTDGSIWTQATASAGFGNRQDHSTVVYNGLMWVIAGGTTGDVLQNDIYSSNDGTTWSLTTSDAGFLKRKQHTSIVYDGKIWVIGGNIKTKFLNDVWYSSDGISWNSATLNAEFTPRAAHASLVYDNKMWVIGGHDPETKNECWYSINGIVWTQAQIIVPFTKRSYPICLDYNNIMWVIAGSDSSSFFSNVWWTQ